MAKSYSHSVFQEAIKKLIYDGKIKTDKDIAGAVGLDKSTVSTYLSGKKKASRNFIEKFEEVFQLSLSDYEKKAGVSDQKIPNADVHRLLSLLEKAQESLIKEQESVKQEQENVVSAHKIIYNLTVNNLGTAKKNVRSGRASK